MSSLSNMFFQDEFVHSYSRKLLLHTYINPRSTALPTTPTPSPSISSSGRNNFDANVVLVLSVLLCAIICSLGLNSLIRCVLRCKRLFGSETSGSHENTSTSLATCGIKKKALKTFPTVNYWHGLQLPGLGKECAICLGDFLKGENVKILPKCNHGFHAGCIDKWLTSHSSCPSCRQSLNDICHKIVTGGNCSSSTFSLPEEQGANNTSITHISPLQHEGFLRNY